MRAAALLLALALLAAPANAQSAADKRARELEEIEKRLKDRAAEERRLKDEAEARAKEVRALRYRMIETANALQDAERRMRDIEGELERLGKEETDLSASLEGEQALLSDILAALQSLEMSKPPALLVSPDDANEAARAAMLLAGAAPVLEGRARELREKLDRLTEVRDERDRERAAFAKTSEEIKARRQLLAELLEKKQTERDVATALAEAAQRETAALAARATTLRDVIRRLERLASAITPRLKPTPHLRDSPVEPPPAPSSKPPADRPAPSVAFAKLRGALKPPVVGRIVAGFGDGKPDGGRLEGVRFLTPTQSIVTAPFEAAVAFARNWEPIGNLIVLDVGGGYHILLIGVGTFFVQEGQRVAAGEPLGAMADGESTLDLEIRKDGEPVDPLLWLARSRLEEMAY